MICIVVVIGYFYMIKSFNNLLKEKKLARVLQEVDSQLLATSLDKDIVLLKKVQLLYFLKRYKEAKECLLNLINNHQTNLAHENLPLIFGIPFVDAVIFIEEHSKKVKAHEALLSKGNKSSVLSPRCSNGDSENDCPGLVPLKLYGCLLLRAGALKEAFKIFAFILKKWGREELNEDKWTHDFWRLSCVLSAVKLFNNEISLKGTYKKLGSKYLKRYFKGYYRSNECEFARLLLEVMACAYNIGEYQWVSEFDEKASPWNLTCTELVKAIKAFALCKIGKLSDAISILQDACEIRCVSINHAECYEEEPCTNPHINRGIYINLFEKRNEFEGRYFEGAFGCTCAQEGYILESSDKDEELLKLFLLSEENNLIINYKQHKNNCFVNALQRCERHEREFGESWVTVYMRAHSAFMNGDYNQAAELLSTSIKSIGNYPFLLYWRGRSFFELGDLDHALEDFNLALKQKPDSLHLYKARADIYLKKGEFAEAYKDIKKLQRWFSVYYPDMSYQVIARMVEAYKIAEEEARRKAREQVLIDMSQEIKNRTVSAINSVRYSENKDGRNQILINKVLRGGDLIRRTVDNLSRSYEGRKGDFALDAAIARETGVGNSLLRILELSIENAINNMFDGKYFADFCHAYFQDRTAFFRAKAAWEQVQHTQDVDDLIKYAADYMLLVQLKDKKSLEDLRLSDTYGSALRLTILIQEIILNAVKYAAFVSRSKRFLKIGLICEKDRICIEICNSFVKGRSARTTKVGQEVIKNICSTLEIVVEKTIVNNDHEIRIYMPNVFAKENQRIDK